MIVLVSVCTFAVSSSRLAMPHDERMLKSAYKTTGGKSTSQGLLQAMSGGAVQHRRQAGFS